MFALELKMWSVSFSDSGLGVLTRYSDEAIMTDTLNEKMPCY